MLVDEATTFGDLKEVFWQPSWKRCLAKTEELGFGRENFFLYREPSAEIDVECIVCNGRDARSVPIPAGWRYWDVGWLTPGLDKVGYDPKQYQGFAFGVGVERIAMLKYGIDDIRLLFEK